MPSSPNYETIQKQCTACNEPLVLNNVRDISRKNFCSRSCANKYTSSNRDSRTFTCYVCDREFESKATTAKFCGHPCRMVSQVGKSYAYLNNNPDAYIAHLLCKKGREHLETDQLLQMFEDQDGKCSISGIPMTFIKVVGSGKIHTNLSIDKIDCSKGYDLDNIQLVCAIVNIMKSTLTIEELKWWAANIVSPEKGVTYPKFS